MTERAREAGKDFGTRPGSEEAKQKADPTVVLPEDMGDGDARFGEGISAGNTRSAEAAGAGTQLLGTPGAGEGQGAGETEVFVLLPELADQHIPVVDTEEVSEDITEIEGRGLSEQAEDVAVLSKNPALPRGGTTVMSRTPLEEIVTDLEDEILTTEVDLGGPTAAEEAPMVREEDELFHRGHRGGSLEGPSSFLPPPRRSVFKKVVLPLAAALLVGVGILYFLKPEWRPDWLAQLGSGKLAVTSKGGTPGKAGAAGNPAVAASLQTFRDKLLVSLELGFGADKKQ